MRRRSVLRLLDLESVLMGSFHGVVPTSLFRSGEGDAFSMSSSSMWDASLDLRSMAAEFREMVLP
jgi:hypothetical protein